MSTNRNQKAYIRIDGSGRDVAGSLILRNKKPGNGKWREVLAYECCNFDPTPTPTTTTTTSLAPLNVGTFYLGGIIASSTIIDNQVMIVDLNDLGSLVWYSVFGGIVTGATATALKTGEANTSSIISTQGAGVYAASATRPGIIPWDLPSKDELNELFVNLTAINAGLANNGGTQIPNSFHWSSSEFDISSAWSQNFSIGSQSSNNKFFPSNVRAVKWVNI